MCFYAIFVLQVKYSIKDNHLALKQGLFFTWIMIKIKKGYNLKIISLLVSVIFLFNSAVYGTELHLRNYILSNSAEGRKRLGDGTAAMLNIKDRGEDVHENAIDWVPVVPVSLPEFASVDLEEVSIQENNLTFSNQQALNKLEESQRDKLEEILRLVSEEINNLKVNIVIEPTQTDAPSIWYAPATNTIHMQVILLTNMVPREYTQFVARFVFVFLVSKDMKRSEAINAMRDEFNKFTDLRGKVMANIEGVKFHAIPLRWPSVNNKNKKKGREEPWNADYQLRPEGFKEADCPFCKQKEYKVVGYVNYSRVVQCTTCNLLRTNPQPIFKQSYSEVQIYADDDSPLASLIIRMCKDGGIDIQDKKILDLGCNSGEMLYSLWKKYGHNPDNLYGIDTFKKAIEYGKEKGLKNLSSEDIFSMPNESYDVVILSSAIEHFNDPVKVLKEIRRILKPNGMLFLLKVPNAESMLRDEPDEPARIVAEWPEHLFYFDYITLTNIVNTAGFKVKVNTGAIGDFSLYWDRDDHSQTSLNHTFDAMARHFGVVERNYPLPDYTNLDYNPETILKELKEKIKKTRQHLIEKFGGINGFEIFEMHNEDFETIENFLKFLSRTNFSSNFYGQDFSLLLQAEAPLLLNELKEQLDIRNKL